MNYIIFNSNIYKYIYSSQKQQDMQISNFSRDHVQLINWTSPVWIINGKKMRCHSHNRPLGRAQCCEEELLEFTQRGIEQIMKLEHGQAKDLVSRFR